MTTSAEDPRQCWETPRGLFDGLQKLCRAGLDVAASPENAKAERFFTAEDDGLSRSWDGERVWCNPPFRRMAPWAEKCARQKDGTAMLLGPASVTQGWFVNWVLPYAEWFLFDGRVSFVPPPGVEASSNRGNCMLAIYDSRHRRPGAGRAGVFGGVLCPKTGRTVMDRYGRREDPK